MVALLPAPVARVNVTDVLAALTNFSDFTRLLAYYPVAPELARRSSLTLLVVPDTNLPHSPSIFVVAAGPALCLLAPPRHSPYPSRSARLYVPCRLPRIIDSI